MTHFNLSHVRSAGFSLLELMAVVAIVGILSAIALPSYSNYVVRGKVPDATSILATKRVLMEQYYQDNQTYASAPACTSDSTSSQYFTFDCSVPGTLTAFTLRATGVNSMAGFTFTVDQNNTKATTIGAGAPSGWSGNANCWVTKPGGVC